MKRILFIFAVQCLILCVCSDDGEIIYDNDVEDRPLSKTCLRCICKKKGRCSYYNYWISGPKNCRPPKAGDVFAALSVPWMFVGNGDHLASRDPAVMGCAKDGGCVGNVCGVLHITRGFWEMAHYKDSNSANTAAYQKCSNNVWCAVRTVQRYMRQYLPACEEQRRDRLLCENAAALHLYGPRYCSETLSKTTQTKLHDCLDEKVWEWLGDAEQEQER